jgi:hypothetical protein
VRQLLNIVDACSCSLPPLPSNSLGLLFITYDSAWRHWGCTTATIIINMKKAFSEADELDGFDDLQPADQEKIRKAWEDGLVADEDIPESARKAEGDDGATEEAKPKKKRAPAKKGDEGEAAKPKKARTSKKASRLYSLLFYPLTC